MNEESLTVHTDGGARGNPGPAACAFTLESKGKIFEKKSRFLGSSTNNFAEYQAIIFAIKSIVNTPGLLTKETSIVFYSDSELVVRQLGGLYRIKNETLKKLSLEIRDLISDNNLNIIFKHIPRNQNKIADYLVNKELDLRV